MRMPTSVTAPERAHNIAEAPAGIPDAQPHERRAPEGDTSYFCGADRDGMIVSHVQSIYRDFGSALIGGDTGILIQKRGAFFALDERHPNHLQPTKRTFHTRLPAFLAREGPPHLGDSRK